MQNKKTGPVTLPGKEASSKNALKHGATSPKLISETEQERYKSLLASLAKQYPADNPLIELQLVRITRATIQLERIQNVIDASFKKSRTRANTAAKVMESFTQQNSQVEELAGRLFDAKNSSDLEKSRAIAFELINPKEIKDIQSMEEFIEIFPLLNKHFEEREKNEKKPIKELLIIEVANLSDIHKQYCDAIKEDDEIEKSLSASSTATATSTSTSGIKNQKLSLLKMFAAWHSKLLRDFFVGPEAYFTVQESINIEEEAMLPDTQEMDRLMRYQTSLQRQLSAAIGELLAINKMSC